MEIKKIAIWVHPTWAPKDLGKEIVAEWEKNIDYFARDSQFGFVLTGNHGNWHSKEWKQRILPLVESLQGIFGERYIKWPENYVESDNSEHIKILIDQWGLPPLEINEFGIPSKLFKEAWVDGLIPGPDYCPAEQRRDIRDICEYNEVRSWRMWS